MFKGSNVALITPFKNDKLDDETYIKLIHFHIENGTNGLVPAGTTGESPTLSHEEHESRLGVRGVRADAVQGDGRLLLGRSGRRPGFVG